MRTSQVSSSQDETLPIAGGIALIVIALGGGAYALSRRRRDEDELVLEPAPTEAVVVPEAEPVVTAPTVAVATPMAAPFAGDMPKTLPNGFDISRFGRHTQAAYLGPTPDNPSASLKHRLRRASFFDQREREAREAAAAGQPVEQATPIEAPVQAAKQDDGQVTVRLSPQRKGGGFGYVLQR
jgi:hypothetical protein